MSHRAQQFSASLLATIREVVLRGFHDPRIGGLITITSVKVAPDMRQAIVMVSIMPEERAELTMHGLQDASRHIRREVGEMLSHRQMPELQFKLDTAGKREAAVLRALQQVREEGRVAPQSAEGSDEAHGTQST